MTMNTFDEAWRMCNDNMFTDKAKAEEIRERHNKKEITDAEAVKLLQQLNESGPTFGTRKDIENEWVVLRAAIDNAERAARRLAKTQFFIGLAGVPVFIVAVALSLFLGWQSKAGATVVAGVLGTCLAAISAHSFYVLRIHQQASLAAERLAEKRVALLYLQIALSANLSKEALQLLIAGTKFFLRIYAPVTLPLQSKDYSAPGRVGK